MEDKGNEKFMQMAIDLSEYNVKQAQGGPFGAVIVKDGMVVARSANKVVTQNDPTAHAEVMALRAAAAKVDNYRLPGCTLYVTIEPCTMCVGAMVHARISHLVYGAPEPRFGAVVSGRRLLDEGEFNHRMSYEGGVLAERCGEVMREFFRSRRSKDLAP